MNDMKCPFCQQELLLSSFRDGDKDNEIWNCLHCQIGSQRKLWQELIRTKELLEVESSEHELCHDVMVKRTEEVNRTRKALDIAVDALKVYANQENWDFEHFYLQRTYEIAENALEQIKTALEQKDVK